MVALVLFLISGPPSTPVGQASPSLSSSPSASPSPTATPTPTPPGPWAFIGSRKTDPVPLTMSELYPSYFTSGTTTYLKVAQTKSTNCIGAIVGGVLQNAVQQAGCTQAVRATYLATAAKVMGTIGVLNLSNYSASASAGKQAGQYEFISRLATKSGPAKNIGGGTGLEEAVAKGHFLILVWAQFTDLTPGKTKTQQQRLRAFMDLLIAQTANVSLSARMVSGTPSPPA